MRIRVYLAVMLVSLLACNNAGAWGLPAVSKLVGVGGGSGGDPDAFLAKAKISEELVNKSADQLFDLVASKEAQAKVEETKKKIAATSDAKEKNALMEEKRSSEFAAISNAAADKSLEEKAKQWDAQKKKLAASSLFNLALGGVMAAELVPQGQNLASSIKSNPALLMKANSMYEAVKCLGGIGTGTMKIVKALPPVFSAANIDVKLPTSSAEAPKSTDL